jgi:hypothetical protein
MMQAMTLKKIENKSSQMGHTKKNISKKSLLNINKLVILQKPLNVNIGNGDSHFL